MSEKLPGFDFIKEKCMGHLACMRACPTHAIRVRDRKAEVNPRLCISCGECLLACPESAYKSQTDLLSDIEKFKFKVAVPSPSLFGQFPIDISPGDIANGLLDMGFDAVYDTSIVFELINVAIQDYLDEYDGPKPLISLACPVVVRLIQVSYPDMVDQIIPIEPPRELSGREMKKFYSKKTGLSPEEIGGIYITPCTAKMVSIKQPAENVKSYLDLAIGISDIYNRLLASITKQKKLSSKGALSEEFKIKSNVGLTWVQTGGQSLTLKTSRYLSVAGIANIIRIFDDIEKGKIRGIDFLECYNCLGGCIGGPLTVDDMFVARSKIHLIQTDYQQDSSLMEDEVMSNYVKGDYMIRQPIKPRVIESEDIDFAEKVRRMKIRDELIKTLPGISCGLCGAPSCAAFAQDVANGIANESECVLLATDRIEDLKKIYDIK